MTGGLGVAALQSWVTKWLGEVTAKAGVRPMIYTSPYFWKTYMGDTTSLANAGYAILWIAHWGVASPTVPAQNWAGRGWTFWQYSNCGTVSGISGCVDLDRYNGTDLARVGYSVFSLAAATSASQAKQGQTASTVVNINRTNFPSEVALDVSGLPTGTAATFSSNPTTDASTGLSVASVAVLNQIRAVDRRRLIKKLGAVDRLVQSRVDEAIQATFALLPCDDDLTPPHTVTKAISQPAGGFKTGRYEE